MLKKNDFFKDLIKFKKKKALILDGSNYVTYQKLLEDSRLISENLDKKKKLVFIFGQNNIETITGYISFVNIGYTVAFLDNKLNSSFIKKLIILYKPSFIFCEKDRINNLKMFKNISQFKNYILLKNLNDSKKTIHKNLMLLMTTSGSTGSPKFVRQSYKNVISNTKEIIKYLNIKKTDITITTLPINYVYGLSVINTHLFSGSTIVLNNYSMVEKKFWELIDSFKVNNFSGVPYNYNIIEKISKKGLPKSLKYTTQAGGKMNHVLLQKIIDVYKKYKIRLVQMYGAAEATSRMSYLNWNHAQTKMGSIGMPIPGGKFYLINKKGEKIKKKSQKKGELVYCGKNVCMGYAKKIKDLSLPDLNKGLLKTGDIAHEDFDGFFYISGRKNRYIKIYGVRVNLSELETILSRKGIDVSMKESGENKIEVYFKDASKTKRGIKFISSVTSINSNVFIAKKLLKKNLTNNFKYKI